jgi:DNA-binding protein H-NS
MEKKITKKDILTAIILNANEGDEVTLENNVIVTGADIIAFAEKTIAQLEAKAAKAKAVAAEKKAEGDALKAKVADALTNELQTVADIFEKIDAEDVTTAKVVYRLTALVKDGVAVKDDVKLEDGRKVKGYALAQ